MNPVVKAVLPILPRFGFQCGYACELGASDGLHYSNTLEIEQRGWIVLCVEPNPQLEAEGRANRRLWRCVAAGPEDLSTASFTVVGTRRPWSSSSALVVRDDYAAVYDGPRNVIQVPVLRLDRILEEAGFPRLDFLSLDVEGYEAEVLRGFTIERWKPKVMAVESLNNDLPIPEGYALRERILYDNLYLRTAP